jgi:hypothetical protein
MDDQSTRKLLNDVSLVKAMLEQHINDSNYYRTKVDNHLQNHPQKMWGLLIGVGWMAILVVSIVTIATIAMV